MTKSRSIKQLPLDECCGCRLCGDICPHNCIEFIKYPDGFLYPEVDVRSCVDCGLCSKLCPSLTYSVNPVKESAYAAYAVNCSLRNGGSSGGVFGVIAENILNDGGKVWGAAFDDNLRLIHKSATNVRELAPLLKSKYLQSDLSDVYQQIRYDLKSGIKTLFCGTPCQCNALKNLAGNQEKLVLVDFICHGVPSQDLFDRTIDWYERKNKVKVVSFVFRYKGKGVKHLHAYMCKHAGDDRPHVGLHYQFPFYFGFQKYITLRQSCYSCKWAALSRPGDITIGDFWGIEKYDETLDSKDGVSLVIINTDKGLEFFTKIIDARSVFTKEFPIDYAALNNGCLSAPTCLSAERKSLFSDLHELSFDEVVLKYLTPRRKWIFDVYYMLPKPFRRIVRILMDKRMKYE